MDYLLDLIHTVSPELSLKSSLALYRCRMKVALQMEFDHI